jgi:hypothetical protein
MLEQQRRTLGACKQRSQAMRGQAPALMASGGMRPATKQRFPARRHQQTAGASDVLTKNSLLNDPGDLRRIVFA